MSETNNTSKKRLWTVVLIFALIVLIACSGWLLWLYKPFGMRTNKAAEQYGTESIGELVKDEKDDLPDSPEYLTKAIGENPDVIGWIQIPGTGDSGKYAEIDYPILRSSSEEGEDFYLTHDFEKKKSHDAAIYIQQINSPLFTNTNTVIYGHDLRDRTMFTALRQYYKKDFFLKHDTIYLAIPGHILTYKIYSAFVFDDRHVLYSYDFDSPEGIQRFIDATLKPHSRLYQVRNDIPVTTEDRLLTLSTCTPNKNESERFLVIGVLVNDQPTK